MGSAAPAAAEASSFEALVSPHLDYLYAFAYKLCGDPNGAEDIVETHRCGGAHCMPKCAECYEAEVLCTCA